MPEPKISPYKLSRDLEEKAKEARKRKEMLESLMPKYKFIIDNLSDHIPQDIKNGFTQAEKLYEDKDYYDAWDHFSKVKEAVDGLMKSIREKRMEELRSLLSYPFVKGDELEKKISGAPEDPEEFIKFYTSTFEEIKIRIKEGIATIGPRELNQEIFKKFGKEIMGIIGKDYSSLKSLLDEILRFIRSYYTERLNSLMKNLDILRDSYSELKISTAQFTSVNEEVLSLVKGDRYDEAIEKLTSFINASEETLRAVIQKLISVTEKSIMEMSQLGADVKQLNDNLAKARDHFSRKEYRMAIDIIRDITGDIERTKINMLESKVNEVKEKIREAKEEKFDVSEITHIFEKTRALLGKRQLKDALNSLEEIVRKVDSMKREREEVMKGIEDIEHRLPVFNALGISVSPEAVSKLKEVAMRNPVAARKDMKEYLASVSRSFEERKSRIISSVREIIFSLADTFQMNRDAFPELRKDMDAFTLLQVLDLTANKMEETLRNFIDKNFPGDSGIRSAFEDFVSSLKKYDFDSAARFADVLNSYVMEKRESMISTMLEEMRETARILTGTGADISGIIRGIDTIMSSKISFNEKVKLISSVHNFILSMLEEPTSIYIQFVDSVIRLMENNRLKVQDEIKKSRSDIEKSGRIVERFKNSGYLDSLATGVFSRTATILAEIDLVDRLFGKRLEDITNEIRFFRRDLEDLKYDEVREGFDRIMENLEIEIIKNGFRELRGMVAYLENVKKVTGLYQDLLPKPDITTLSGLNLAKIYQDLENALDDFRHRIFTEISVLASKRIVKDLFSQQISSTIKMYAERQYLEAWNEIMNLKGKVESIESHYEEGKRTLDSVKKNVKFFENLGFNLPRSREIIVRLESILESLDFSAFAEAYISSYLEVRNEIYSVLNSYIAEVEEKMNSLRGKRNVLIADGLITSAKRAIKLDKFDETIKYLFDALDELQVDEVVKKISSSLLQRVKKVVATFGTIAPKELSEGLSRANIFLGQGKYSAAVSELNSLLMKYEDISEKISLLKTMIDDVKEKINSAVSLGINVQEFLKNYQAARVYFQAGQVEKSFDAIEILGRNLNIAMEDTLSREVRSMFYISGTAGYVGLDFSLQYNAVKEKSIEILLALVVRGGVFISTAVREYRENVNKFTEKMALLDRVLRERLDAIGRISSRSGMMGFKDHLYLLDLWSNRQYLMLYDAFPMVESKVLRYYVQAFSSSLENMSREIAVNSHFSTDTYSRLDGALKLYMSAGTLDPLTSEDAVRSYSMEVYREALSNISSRVNGVKEGDDLFRAYYIYLAQVMEKKYRDVIGEYIESRKKMIMDRAHSAGIQLTVPEIPLGEISSALQAIHLLEQDLEKRLEAMAHISDVHMVMESDGKMVRGRIDLNYRGKEEVKILYLRLSGPIEEKIVEMLDLRNGDSRSADISFSVSGNGRVKVMADYDGDRREMEFDADLYIDRGFKGLKAAGTEKCGICRGKIFKDLDMVICEKCGATYHYQCAKRIGKCTSCGRVFDFTDKKKLEVKLTI